jgi:hypothetical protein
MKRNVLAILMISTTILVSCSAENRLKRRLTGDWTITRYQEENVNGGGGTTANVGTISFSRNGRGTKNLSGIPWRQNIREGREFRWQNSAESVTIFDQNSIFAKSWIITVNKKKLQEWKSTDRGTIQVMELRR